MEVNSASQLYSQDSLAAEVLNKLQSGAGFSSVPVPEGMSLHPPHVGSSLMSASSSALNSTLLTQTLGHSAGSADSSMLGPAGSLDPALTHLLAAAQTGNSSSTPTALTPNVAVTCPSSSAHGPRPVLSTALPAHPSSSASVTSDMIVPADPSFTNPASVGGHETMTITVHCTMSDTVVVVGQQNWQCCMCREICGFDASIDQHLSLKHNLSLKPVPAEGNWARSKGELSQLDEKSCDNRSAAEACQAIPEPALPSLQKPDSANSRSGLEREVALLMAQTFTHASDMNVVREDVKQQEDSLVGTMPQRNQKESVLFTDTANSKAAGEELPSPPRDNPGEDFTSGVYENMIRKIEGAISSTVDAAAKNDLLLVSTELARMQKELASKRRQMKKIHRYIPCPECGKEVRNRKDLIKQHNRCHEKTKKYKCLVCNKMFKYLHTLRRHVVKQGHKGGLPEKVDDNPASDVDTNDFTEDLSFDGLKMEVDEVNKEPEMIINVDLASLTSGAPAVSSETKENGLQEHGEPAYEKILAALLSRGAQTRTETGRKQSLLQCFVCDREIRNRNYYITRHARCHMEDLCYTCSVCGMEFYRSDYYREHMLEHGDSPSSKQNDAKRKTESDEFNQMQFSDKPKRRWNPKPATVSCKICDQRIFNRTYNIKRHALQHSIVEWESILRYPRQALSGSSGSGQHFLRCGVCCMNFQSYARKRLHMLKHRTTFQCRACDAKFDSGTELLSHSQTCRKTSTGRLIQSTGETVSGEYKPSSGEPGGDRRRPSTRSSGRGRGEPSTSATGRGRREPSTSREDSRSPLPSINETSVSSSERRRKDRSVTASHHGTTTRGPTWKKQAAGQAPSPRKWTCPICQASIIHTLPSISRHMRELHSEGQPHTCPKCSRTYSSYHKMRRHLKSHADMGGICDVCGRIFQTKAALRSHTKLHATPEGMFQCPKCPTSFRFQGRLEKHMRKHEDHTDVCPHCGKVYISKIHLQRHISVVHLGIKDYRYKCDQCGAQFFENIQLRDHIAYRHQGVQIYTCKYCNKGFNCRPTMVRHERKEHTNYLPYKCRHCSQGFPEKSKLVSHEMTHTGMSPHRCEVCGKFFTTGGALRAHKNLHLGVKPFECTACGKTYLKNWHLQQHIRKAHQSFEVMVYNLASQTHQTQNIVQPPASQQNILPGVAQPCLQSTETKFIPGSVQGEYLHMQ